MDENSISGGERVDSQCEDSEPKTEEIVAFEKQKDLTSMENVSPAGTKIELSTAGQGEDYDSPSKKSGPPNFIKCEICLCEMSSDLVLTSHINGSRHKKRMKALEIVANLKAAGEKGVDLEPDNGSNTYRCEICSLTVNSPQQLEIHLAGAKHKNRMAKEKLLNIVITSPNSQVESVTNADSPPLKKRKKDGKFLFCDVCNLMLNSEIQYEQHVLSKKHLGRAKGDNYRKKRADRLENKPNFVQNFPGGNRFQVCKDSDRDHSHDSPTQQFQPNSVNRMHQVISPQNNRTNAEFSQLNRGGMSSGPPFGNYFQPRPFMNNHRNFGNNFGRISETGKSFSKARPHFFNSHPDTVLQASSSKS